jgi:hypothetical protein
MTDWQARIASTFVICAEPGRYLGWPTIVRRSNGELVVAFSGDRDEHVCPFGKTQLVSSSDDGRIWSAPRTVTDTPLDDRDAGIIELPSGGLLMSWFTSIAFAEREDQLRAAYGDATVDGWAERKAALTPAVVGHWLGNWTRRSFDGGVTWDDPVPTLGSAPHGPIVLRDGRLLYVGQARVGSDGRRDVPLVVEESRDEGASWQQIASLELPAWASLGHCSEPHVVEADSGKLVALVRYEPPAEDARWMLQAESFDGGLTWTCCRSSGVWGWPPHLLRLQNGWLLLSCGHRRPPYGERARISRDEGQTWDEPEIELCPAPNHDLGYPATAQLADGTLLTVFYQCPAVGEKTVLMATRWHLDY